MLWILILKVCVPAALGCYFSNKKRLFLAFLYILTQLAAEDEILTQVVRHTFRGCRFLQSEYKCQRFKEVFVYCVALYLALLCQKAAELGAVGKL